MDAMQRYTQALADGGSAQEVSDRIQRRIASEVIRLLDIVRGESPILEGGRTNAESTYRWALQLAGGSLTSWAARSRYVGGVVDRKIEQGMLDDD